MAVIKLNTKKCKGCFICVSVCPKQALFDSGKINEKGYKIVAHDNNKCVKCGTCFRMCPDFVFELID